MRTAIVTGGAGFLGQALVDVLVKNNIRAYATYKPNGTTPKLKSSEAIEWIPCNICDIKLLAEKIKEPIDVFYHLAWDGLKNDSILDYTLQIKNLECTLNAIDTAQILACKKFIGAGSISQLDTKYQKKWFSEKHGYYKHIQNACLEMGKELSTRKGIEFYWPIITNIYGEGETSPRLVNTLIRKLQNNESMALSSGEQLYDFIHIEDAAEMYYHIGLSGKENQQYIIGSGNPQQLKSYFKIINEIVNPNLNLVLGNAPFQGTRLPREIFDISNFIDDTGFRPKVSFEEGIRRTSNWIKNN